MRRPLELTGELLRRAYEANSSAPGDLATIAEATGLSREDCAVALETLELVGGRLDEVVRVTVYDPDDPEGDGIYWHGFDFQVEYNERLSRKRAKLPDLVRVVKKGEQAFPAAPTPEPKPVLPSSPPKRDRPPARGLFTSAGKRDLANPDVSTASSEGTQKNEGTDQHGIRANRGDLEQLDNHEAEERSDTIMSSEASATPDPSQSVAAEPVAAYPEPVERAEPAPSDAVARCAAAAERAALAAQKAAEAAQKAAEAAASALAALSQARPSGPPRFSSGPPRFEKRPFSGPPRENSRTAERPGGPERFDDRPPRPFRKPFDGPPRGPSKFGKGGPRGPGGGGKRW